MKKIDVKGLFYKVKGMWNTPLEGRYLNFKEIMCFGGAGLGGNFIVCIIGSLITATQISEVYQIGVVHGPIICLVASVLGLIIQPIWGKMMQNTNTKWGRYKPYLIFLAPMISVCAILSTWQPQNLTEQARMIYAYCVCIPTLILWNLWNNTFNMMPAVITPNQQERADVWSPIGLVINFAPTVINFIKGFIRSYFLSIGKEYLAYRWMGFISVALGLILIALIFRVKERIIVTVENNEKVGLLEGLKMVIQNKPLMIFSLALILGCMRSIIEVDAEMMGKLRYATTIEDGLKIFSSLTLLTGFAATPNMILLPFLTRKFNNKTIWMGWLSLNILGYLVLGVVGVQNIPQGTVSAVVITALRFVAIFNAFGSLQPLMLSEIYDYQQYKTGKRLEGFIQTFAYALVAVFSNIANVLMAYVKQSMGYEPKNYFNVSTVTPDLMDVATRYFNLALIVSVVSGGLMLITMIFYNLSKKDHAKIMEELKMREINE
ncbi:MAG: MFS transporter [Clostridia bacterium]|nr:MFS transporter [Clostridia bacterium]